MKLQSKLTLIGSVAALATSPLALANKEGAAKPEAAEVQDAEPEVIICEEGPDNGEVVVDEETSESEDCSDRRRKDSRDCRNGNSTGHSTASGYSPSPYSRRYIDNDLWPL